MAQYVGLPWRFIFTDLNTVTTTWADGLLTNRTLTFNLDQPAQIAASVYPDDPRVNLLFTDGYPLVAQSNRLVYAFRREAPAPIGSTPQDPWVCRGAGILMQPEDEADTDIPLTNFTAFDPWALMAAWPVWASGGLPGPQGYNFLGPYNGTYWALTVYKAALDAIAAGQWGPTPSFVGPPGTGGNGSFIDAGDGSRSGEGDQYQDWGGTSFYQGTLEITPVIDLTLTSGNTVADTWTQLCDAGNCDIVLTPIYDPVNRPGYTHELSIYNLAGCERPNSIFSWAMLRRNLKRIDRMHDATPGGFLNLGLYFGGAGGNVPTPLLGPLIPSDASIDTFGPYWSTQFQPNQTDLINPAAILQLLQQALTLGKQGKRTLTMDPIPERSPIPLLDYNIGDRAPVYAPNKLRVTAAGFQRVQTIPVQITDDGIEEIVGLVTSPDWRQVGAIVTTELVDGGTGYVIGDTGFIDTGNQEATYIVDSVSGGAVVTYTITDAGSGYAVGDGDPPGSGITTETGGSSPGSGTGFTISITAIDTAGTC